MRREAQNRSFRRAHPHLVVKVAAATVFNVRWLPRPCAQKTRWRSPRQGKNERRPRQRSSWEAPQAKKLGCLEMKVIFGGHQEVLEPHGQGLCPTLYRRDRRYNVRVPMLGCVIEPLTRQHQWRDLLGRQGLQVIIMRCDPRKSQAASRNSSPRRSDLQILKLRQVLQKLAEQNLKLQAFPMPSMLCLPARSRWRPLPQTFIGILCICWKT